MFLVRFSAWERATLSSRSSAAFSIWKLFLSWTAVRSLASVSVTLALHASQYLRSKVCQGLLLWKLLLSPAMCSLVSALHTS